MRYESCDPRWRCRRLGCPRCDEARRLKNIQQAKLDEFLRRITEARQKRDTRPPDDPSLN